MSCKVRTPALNGNVGNYGALVIYNAATEFAPILHCNTCTLSRNG
jgi:hypothetical protein